VEYTAQESMKDALEEAVKKVKKMNVTCPWLWMVPDERRGHIVHVQIS
jgi:hypothetical protein